MNNVTLDDILTILNFFVQKSDKPLEISKEHFNGLLEKVNLDYLDYRYREWEENRDASDDLAVLKDVNESETATGGVWSKPTNFYRLSSVTANSGDLYLSVDIVTDMELAERLVDSLTEPSATNPVCTVDESNIRFYPSSVTDVNITYLKYPTTPLYDLKVENGVNVYDSAGSDQFDWPDSCAPDLIRLMLGYMDIVVDKRMVLEQINRMEGD